MSSPVQTPASSSQFKMILDAAMIKYQKKTGKSILSHPLSVELQRCNSIDAILAILQDQAEAFEQFRGGDWRLMEGIGLSVHILHALSETLREGLGPVFPPVRAVFSGIGILLAAAKDVRESHDALVDLFERIEGFFKRLKVYTETSSTTGFAEVLVNVVVEVLNILSIATKEMEQSRAKTFIRKLLVGGADIENALKRLDDLIREEHQVATVHVLKVTSGLKDDAKKAKLAMQKIANDVDEVRWSQIQQDVRKWLSPPDPSTNYNIACKAYHQGTAAWLFEERLFKDWELTASLLWIHGKPGSGKSILCSAIIKHIMTLRNAGQAYLAYFYFDFRDEDKQNVRNLLTSLLIQLSTYSKPCRNIITRLYLGHGNGTQQPSDDALTNCLKEALVVADEHPTYIILDALDECPDISGMPTPREVVLNFVEDLVGQRLPSVHICVTSRLEIDIKTVLKPLAINAVSIHDESGQKKDIANYVCSVVYSDRKMQRWRDEDKKLVVEALSERADGMFRWVFCQLETLRHSFPRNLRRILEELPKSLDETYERLLKGIGEDNREYACRLLHCLAVAVRPLRVEELAEILTFDFDMVQEGIPKFHADWRWKDQEYAVLSTCSSLISVVENDGSQVVQFSHFSVKEFLMSNRLATSTGDVSRYHIRPGPAHTIFARVCLGFLLHLDHHIDVKGIKAFPLAKYAARHWVAHVKFEDVASRVKDGMESLFDPDKPHFAAWVQIHDMDLPFFQVSTEKANPLYYSALCGLHDLVEHLAIKHPRHVNALGGKYESPLLAALLRKHIRVAELLLSHGADVNVRGTRGQTPLHNAVLWSYDINIDPVEFLLKHGADVNAQRRDLCTPLHLAADIGELGVSQTFLETTAKVRDNGGRSLLHLVSGEQSYMNEYNRPSLVRLLLAHGADANARDVKYANPLRYACYNGKLEVAQVLLDHGAKINDQGAGPTLLHLLLERNQRHNYQNWFNLAQLLLKHGAEVNSQDRDNLTPLHMASCKGWLEFARMFLDYGANPNAKDNQGQTPLHLLSAGIQNSRDVLDLAELLLTCGADVNAQDENNSTLLHWASRRGELEIARMLLGHGANPNAMNDQGQTPLHLLSEGIQNSQDVLDLVVLLLKSGADANARDKNNITPLYLASYDRRLEIARIFFCYMSTQRTAQA